MRLPSLLLAGLGLALSVTARGTGSRAACTSFKLHLPDVTLTAATHFAANATVQLTTNQSSINTHALPAFCRLQLVITTNATAGSSALTEIWLPDAWNGRSLAVGNGVFAGGSESSEPRRRAWAPSRGLRAY